MLKNRHVNRGVLGFAYVAWPACLYVTMISIGHFNKPLAYGLIFATGGALICAFVALLIWAARTRTRTVDAPRSP